jgi:phage terminase small subunit
MVKLNPKQRAFIREYLQDFNGSAAAIRAGYSARTSRSVASELLTKPNIQAAIRKAQEEAQRKAILSFEEALDILSGVARANLTDYVDPVTGQVDVRRGDPRALLEITQVASDAGAAVTRYKLHPRLQAVKQLAEMLGWESPKKVDVQGACVLLPPEDPLNAGKGLRKIHDDA